MYIYIYLLSTLRQQNQHNITIYFFKKVFQKHLKPKTDMFVIGNPDVQPPVYTDAIG